jgi:hypothetical protein
MSMWTRCLSCSETSYTAAVNPWSRDRCPCCGGRTAVIDRAAGVSLPERYRRNSHAEADSGRWARAAEAPFGAPGRNLR